MHRHSLSYRNIRLIDRNTRDMDHSERVQHGRDIRRIQKKKAAQFVLSLPQARRATSPHQAPSEKVPVDSSIDNVDRHVSLLRTSLNKQQYAFHMTEHASKQVLSLINVDRSSDLVPSNVRPYFWYNIWRFYQPEELHDLMVEAGFDKESRNRLRNSRDVAFGILPSSGEKRATPRLQNREVSTGWPFPDTLPSYTPEERTDFRERIVRDDDSLEVRRRQMQSAAVEVDEAGPSRAAVAEADRDQPSHVWLLDPSLLSRHLLDPAPLMKLLPPMQMSSSRRASTVDESIWLHACHVPVEPGEQIEIPDRDAVHLLGAELFAKIDIQEHKMEENSL